MDLAPLDLGIPASATTTPSAHLRGALAWHALPEGEVLSLLGSGSDGLSLVEARRRLVSSGTNELKENRQAGPIQIFLAQFKSLLIWILLAAGLISGLVGEVLDCVAIFTIVFLNAVIGFYQEFKAKKSMAALKKMTAPQAKVRREGRVHSIPASEIVVGDILVLEAGTLVAADARLLRAASLKCIESILTGESEAVDKRVVTCESVELPLGDRENMLFMGTAVAGGNAEAVVVATAMRTELGLIADMLEAAGEEDAPLQQQLASFGHRLVWVSLGIVAVLFALGLWRGTPRLEVFMTSVSLAVAAVPEGLPAVVTVALALGVARMSKRGALVRRLAAVETLGETTVICTDKTGTLTVGEMTVRALYVAGESFEVIGEGYGPEGEVRFGTGVPKSGKGWPYLNWPMCSWDATTPISFRIAATGK